MVGKSKYNTLKGIKERVWQKINNWKNTFLSSTGKEVMIKVVLQAIPTYTMSVFKLSKKMCKDLCDICKVLVEKSTKDSNVQ